MSRFVLDGIPVSYCEGAFTKAFDMSPEDAEQVVYDDMVVMVVVVHTTTPSFHTSKSGDLIRRNKFEVQAAKVATGAMGTEIAEMFDLEIQQKLPFAVSPPPSQAAAPYKAVSTPVQSAVAPPSIPVGSTGTSVASSVPHGVPVTAPVTHGDPALQAFIDGA